MNLCKYERYLRIICQGFRLSLSTEDISKVLAKTENKTCLQKIFRWLCKECQQSVFTENIHRPLYGYFSNILCRQNYFRNLGRGFKLYFYPEDTSQIIAKIFNYSRLSTNDIPEILAKF